MKIILAYSGGLDTSVLVHWYANSQNAEVITYCADVGQEEELDGLEEKALATGATAHRTLDLVDEFAKDFIYTSRRTEGAAAGIYPNPSAKSKET